MKWPSLLFYRTPTIDVLLHFKKEILKKWGLCCSMEAKFFSKNRPKILKNFDKITQKHHTGSF